MNTIELNCPHCGATIHADDDLVSFICPGCGYEIVLQTQANTPVFRSAPLENTTIKPEKRKSPFRVLVSALLAFLVVGGGAFWGLSEYTDKKIANEEKNVWEYIDNKNFDRANTALSVFDGRVLFRERWKSKKQNLLQEIENANTAFIQSQLEAQQEQEQAQQEQQEAQSQEAFYQVPMTQKEAVSKTVEEVKNEFYLFSNIQDDPITAVDEKEAKKAEDGKVKAIIIKVDGKEIAPKKGEKIKGNAEIIITYYDFSNSPEVPISSDDAVGQDYKKIMEQFNNVGFKPEAEKYSEVQRTGLWTQVKNGAKRVVDRIRGEKTPDTVQSISIQNNGEEITKFEKGARYPGDSKIIIKYY